ncbi:MAG: Flp family type IVb pilin [Planctomycetaceae bacterium]
MSKFTASVKKFLVSEDGPTAVEYAVMLALIVVACIVGVTAVGTKANAKFNSVATSLN